MAAASTSRFSTLRISGGRVGEKAQYQTFGVGKGIRSGRVESVAAVSEQTGRPRLSVTRAPPADPSPAPGKPDGISHLRLSEPPYA